MAINQLKAAFEKAEKRPEKDQIMIAERILEAIADQVWEEWLARPEIDEMLDKLEKKAIEEHESGKTRKWTPGVSLEILCQQ